MRNYIFLWIVAFVVHFPSPIECINGFLRERNKLFEPRQQSGYQLRKANQYQDCVDDLFASDLNGDSKVTEEEYVMFILTRSRGAIDVGGYTSLPFPLISNFIYGSCFCSFVMNVPNCCVGAEAGINIEADSYPFIEDNLITICRTANQAIVNEIGTFPPTKSPTVSPTNIITEQPSGNPTVAPTNIITEQPSGNPTVAPTNIITEQPSGNPTVAPTNIITEQPSENPTVAPTFPASSHNAFPTLEPTISPSSMPTNYPTPTPTNTPTTIPTLVPSVTPTNMPTMVTTTATSTDPTDSSSDDLLCLDFQYGIENNQDLTSDDIENGFNNTYKSDLIIATREIIIQVLNEAFPRDQEERALHRDADDRPRFKTFEDIPLLGVVNLGRFQLDVGEDESMQGQRRAVILPSNSEEQTGADKMNSDINDSMDNNRRLAFYKDSYPPDILSVIDNSFCPESEEIVCSIVDTRVCVILEEGEDGDEVKEQLLDGIKISFQDGSFESALPSVDESV